MGRPEDGETWGFVAASGFNADEAVFDNVDAADSMTAGEGIGGKEELKAVGRGA